MEVPPSNLSRLLPGFRGSKRRLFISPCVWRRKAPWHSWISSARTGQTRRSLCLICLNRGLARRISPKAQRALCSLHSNCLERRTAEGNTALHYSVLHHKPESLKLLLKAKAVLHTGTLSDSFFFPPLHIRFYMRNDHVFSRSANSELCRRDGPGCCQEAPVHAVHRAGELRFGPVFIVADLPRKRL